MDQEVEVMRVSRALSNSKLIVRTGQLGLESIDQVEDPELRGRLLAAVGDLIAFVGGYQALVVAGVAPEISQHATPPVVAQAELQEPTEEFLADLQRESRSIMAKLESAQMKERSSQEIDDGEPAVALNLADQIDTILQRQLADNRQLSGRSIHLMSTPTGGLRIEVDNQIYSSIDEVDDAPVQEAIIRARREWELSA